MSWFSAMEIVLEDSLFFLKASNSFSPQGQKCCPRNATFVGFPRHQEAECAKDRKNS